MLAAEFLLSPSVYFLKLLLYCCVHRTGVPFFQRMEKKNPFFDKCSLER